jgi:fluoroquinolone transport system permease protein
MDLIRAGYGGAAPEPGWSVAWLVFACGLAAAVAHRQLRRYPRAGAPARVRVGRPVRHDRGPVRSFLRTDLASIRRDPMLVLIGVSPLLLGLAARFGYPPLHDWLAARYGFALDPYRPLLLAVAVLLHVPVTFGMVGALLVLDDLDDRALTALRTSPLTLPRYLAYRTGLVTVAALVGLAVAAPLSGLAAPGSWPRLGPAVLLAGLVAPLFMLTALALARNKVEGVAATKLLGLPCYAPLATWWLTGPAGWPFAVLPTWWVVQAQWTAWPYALGGAAVTVAALALLARRVLTRLAST